MALDGLAQRSDGLLPLLHGVQSERFVVEHARIPRLQSEGLVEK